MIKPWRPGIAISVTQRHCVSSLSRDMLNHELPSLSPVSIDGAQHKKNKNWSDRQNIVFLGNT